MDQDRLRGLLVEAKAKGFRHPPVPHWARGTELEHTLMRIISTEREIENALLKFMATAPEFEAFNDKMLNQGRGASRVELKTALKWLLYTTSTSGEDAALSALARYAQLEHVPVEEFLAIAGVEVNKSVELAGGMRLIPFSEVPPSFVTDALDPALLKSEFLASFGISPAAFIFSRHVPPKAALVKPAQVKPKFWEAVSDQFSFLPESPDIYEACECITLVSSASPLSITSCVMPEQWVPCTGFVGIGLSHPPDEVIGKTVVKLTDPQLIDLQALYGRFRTLDQKVRNSLRVPIQRLNQARRRSSLADKAIDLGVAFEALYLNDRSHKEQISFTFRLRAAWHLGVDPDNRKALIKAFNKIYECRSIAVHTGSLSKEEITMNGKKVNTKDFLDYADALCVCAIRKVIDESGYPVWDSIVLGSG